MEGFWHITSITMDRSLVFRTLRATCPSTPTLWSQEMGMLDVGTLPSDDIGSAATGLDIKVT
jgi:hypothetical protein